MSSLLDTQDIRWTERERVLSKENGDGRNFKYQFGIWELFTHGGLNLLILFFRYMIFTVFYASGHCPVLDGWQIP